MNINILKNRLIKKASIAEDIRKSTADPEAVEEILRQRKSLTFPILGGLLGAGAGGVLGGLGSTFVTDNKNAILPSVGIGSVLGALLGSSGGRKLNTSTNPISDERLFASDENLEKRLMLIDDALNNKDLSEEEKEELLDFKNETLAEKGYRKVYGIY